VPSAGLPTFCARQDEEAEGQPLRLVRFPEPRSGVRTTRQWGVAPRHTAPADRVTQTVGGGDSDRSCLWKGAGPRTERRSSGVERFQRSGRRGFSPPGNESTGSTAGRGGAERLLSAEAGPEYISLDREGRNNWAGLERLQRGGGGPVAGATERTGPAHVFRAGPGSAPGDGDSAGAGGGGSVASGNDSTASTAGRGWAAALLSWRHGRAAFERRSRPRIYLPGPGGTKQLGWFGATPTEREQFNRGGDGADWPRARLSCGAGERHRGRRFHRSGRRGFSRVGERFNRQHSGARLGRRASFVAARPSGFSAGTVGAQFFAGPAGGCFFSRRPRDGSGTGPDD
jgi:hypothetical protein